MEGPKFNRAPTAPESKPRYVMDMAPRMPIGHEGEQVERVSAARVMDGKPATVRLTAVESVVRDGWNEKAVMEARKGDILTNLHGGYFEVVDGTKNKLTIRETKTGDMGEIRLEPREVSSRMYKYETRNKAGRTKTITVHEMAYLDSSLDTGDLIDSLVSALPAAFVDCIDEIRIARESQSRAGSFKPEMSLVSSAHVVTIHVDSDSHDFADSANTLYHEVGHAVAKTLKGTTHPGPKWKMAMSLDGTSISEYASKKRYKERGDEGEIEDFAETVMLYIATDGAHSGKHRAVRDACEHRFRILDEIVESPPSRSLLQGMIDRIRGVSLPL